MLGAFAAGIVVGLVTKSEDAEPVRSKLEGIGFGFVIPIFFVYSGITFDLPALFESATSALRLPVFLALFLLVRGAPVWLLYRGVIAAHDRLPLALTSATALPLVVAITTIGLEEGRMRPGERRGPRRRRHGLGARLPARGADAARSQHAAEPTSSRRRSTDLRPG